MNTSLDLIANPMPCAASGACDDEALVARIRAGDQDACEPLMRRYNQRLYRLARSIVRDDDAAEDVLQESYIRAFNGIASYHTGNFAAWISRIVLNEGRMYLRRRRREVPLEIDDEGGIVRRPGERAMSDDYTPFDGAANKELATFLQQVIDRLPEPFRMVFVMRSVQQLSVSETAASLAIPEATVKSRLHRARALLQDSLLDRFQAGRADVFEFAGRRCDRVVARVMERLAAQRRQ